MRALTLFLTAFCLLAGTGPQVSGEGRLVIVGGALSNAQDDIFDALLESERPVSELKAAVIPAASSKPSFYGEAFREELVRRGLSESNVRILPLAQRDDSSTPEIDESKWATNGDSKEIVDWIKSCDLVWFTGGDQSRITATLMPDEKESQTLKALRELLRRGGTIGGTSAGAAMMSQTMIVGGSSEGALFEGLSKEPAVDQEGGPLLLGKGLGFFTDGIIDQHFDAKARLGRLILAVANESHKSQRFGFGIDENTALVVDLEDRSASVAGASQVILVSDLQSDKEQGPSVLQTRIGSLGPGDRIDLDSKTITPASDKDLTTGHEYYKIRSPHATGVLSSYGSLNMLLTRLLIDNAESETAISYLFNDSNSEGFRLRFERDEKSRGYWTYRNGQSDHYTVVDALLRIEPITIKIQSR